MTDDIIADADELRDRAIRGPVGQRRSSVVLYRLLADCMALAERCRDPEQRETLRMAIMANGGAGNRTYIEHGSDEYILVCRYVFADKNRSKERANASRYAHALREAARRQIGSGDLLAALRDGGGINSLFLTRPLAARSCRTKTLYLASQIVVPKLGAFSLTLERQADNSFRVLGTEGCTISEETAA